MPNRKIDWKLSSVLLPDDMIGEILSRLPVKDILRFRSVSKSWLSIISRTDFANLQLKRASVSKSSFPKIMLSRGNYRLRSLDCNTSICSFNDLSASRLLELPFIMNAGLKILGSSNGLLCVCTCAYKRFHLWNPTTNESKRLPALKYSQVRKVAEYGFGYDASTNDYKILIATVNRKIADDVVINIFSLKNGTWKCFRDSEYLNHRMYCSSGVFFNGAIHWPGREGNVTVIVCFGLADESFKKLSVPDIKNIRAVEFEGCRIGVLDTFLCLTVYTTWGSRAHTTWMMKEYGVRSSWIKLITRVYDWVNWYVDVLTICSPLSYTGWGEILFRYEGLSSCYIETKSAKVRSGFCNAIDYDETLISPNELNGTETETEREIKPVRPRWR